MSKSYFVDINWDLDMDMDMDIDIDMEMSIRVKCFDLIFKIKYFHTFFNREWDPMFNVPMSKNTWYVFCIFSLCIADIVSKKEKSPV